MRSVILSLTTGILALMLGGVACAQDSQDTFWARTEALWLKRNTPNNAIGIVDADSFANPPGAYGITGSALDFELEPGVRLVLGAYLSGNSGVQVTYFGLNNWNATASLANADEDLQPVGIISDAVRMGLDLDNFEDAFRYDVSYSSQLNSVAVDYLSWNNNGFTWQAGGRFISYRETFGLDSIDEENPGPTDIGYFRVNTRNYLFGPQVGGSWQQTMGEFFTIGLRGNAGAMLNFHDRGVSINNPDDGGLNKQDHDNTFASIVEVGVFATLALTDNLLLRGGYDFLMLNGVGLALDQTSLNGIQTSNVYFHGPSAGLEFHY